MASEDLGYWTFRGSDVRALLFYLSPDAQGGRGTVRECRWIVEGVGGQRRKRGEVAKKNKGSEAKEKRREWGVSKTEMKREGGRTGESRGGEIISHKGGGSVGRGMGGGERTDPQLIIPSCLHLSVASLTVCIRAGGYVILIKRSRVTAEPSI